jgi:hypothetical protein
MKTEINSHARETMFKYSVSESLVEDCLNVPDDIVESYNERKIYHKKLNGYVLRVVVEESKEIKRIITVYKSEKAIWNINMVQTQILC